jgi:hypothetical protein
VDGLPASSMAKFGVCTLPFLTPLPVWEKKKREKKEEKNVGLRPPSLCLCRDPYTHMHIHMHVFTLLPSLPLSFCPHTHTHIRTRHAAPRPPPPHTHTRTARECLFKDIRNTGSQKRQCTGNSTGAAHEHALCMKQNLSPPQKLQKKWGSSCRS